MSLPFISEHAPSPTDSGARTLGRHRALGGILVRKERWTLSRPAKLIVAAACAGAIFVAIRFAYPFLSVTDREQGEFMVVEGWIPSYALDNAVVVFNSGSYRKVLTSGGPFSDDRMGRSQETYADWTASRLRRLRMNNDLIQSIPCLATQRDRTYTAALAVKQWLQQNAAGVKSVDVVTLGPHARRTRLLYQRALGNKVAVGVIAVEDREYDPAHWWQSSEGVRAVIGEGIAYLYARILFRFYLSESAEKN